MKLHRKRLRNLCVGTIVSFASLGIAHAQIYTWVGTSFTNYNWSNKPNWKNSVAPPTAGGSTVSLLFGGPQVTNFSGPSSVNDFGTFTLNSLTFSTGSIFAYTVSGGTLKFVNNGATSPTISQTSTSFGTETLASAIQTDTTLNITQTGTQDLAFTGQIAGTGGLNITSIGYGSDLGGAFITLSGNSLYSGGTALTGGNLYLGSANALGSGMLTVNASPTPPVLGGAASSLTFGTSAPTIGNNIVLNSDLVLVTNGATSSFSSISTVGTLGGTISGTGGLTVRLNFINPVAVTLSGTAGYTGLTDLSTPSSLYQSTSSGSLTLAMGGQLTNSSSIVIGSGMTLSLLNTTAGNTTDRVADSIPVLLNGGRLSFTGAAGLSSSETLGTVTINGTGTVVLTAQTTAGSSKQELLIRRTAPDSSS